MGHERLNTLPKTHKWRNLVQEIGSLPETGFDVAEVARLTLVNVRHRLRQIHLDNGVQAAFTFLVALSHASRSPNVQQRLLELGISLPDKATPVALAQAVRDLVGKHVDSMEYAEIAESSAIQAVSYWHARHKDSQFDLFYPDNESFAIWRNAGTGAGFCELARVFFANFIERYLKYFLDREASAALPTVDDRILFERRLDEYVDIISRHAFETTKITESFAAGWFNRHARDRFPTANEISRFLSFSFAKVREEIDREATS